MVLDTRFPAGMTNYLALVYYDESTAYPIGLGLLG